MLLACRFVRGSGAGVSWPKGCKVVCRIQLCNLMLTCGSLDLTLLLWFTELGKEESDCADCARKAPQMQRWTMPWLAWAAWLQRVECSKRPGITTGTAPSASRKTVTNVTRPDTLSRIVKIVIWNLCGGTLEWIYILYVTDGPRDFLPKGLTPCSLHQLGGKPSSKGIPFGEDETACNRILWAMSLGATNRSGPRHVMTWALSTYPHGIWNMGFGGFQASGCTSKRSLVRLFPWWTQWNTRFWGPPSLLDRRCRAIESHRPQSWWCCSGCYHSQPVAQPCKHIITEASSIYQSFYHKKKPFPTSSSVCPFAMFLFRLWAWPGFLISDFV